MLNFFIFSIIIFFLLLPCSCWRNLCLLVVVEDKHRKAGYELVRAFQHLHYNVLYLVMGHRLVMGHHIYFSKITNFVCKQPSTSQQC
ncbi:hypothetical protein L873DRAFT_159478 [Choiromyces venosus 120613-1]|uniref:Secreted protein n=1 Tax=Choiromyces venosus 120613-1 TaxID=1336337 RepID=A0A3N4JYF7_9PEZI|nr:hypothetical protein L873DRAFT_159478 [Choiromyces venosus 120613-1]